MKKLSINDFPKPKSHEQEVLLELILTGKASIETFFWMAGFRTRISQLILKRDLFIERESKKHTSKYGNGSTYYIHFLPENQKEKAIKLYHSLNKN